MTTISEINTEASKDVNVKGKVTKVYGPDTVTCLKGTPKEYETTIVKIQLEDETGSIWVDAWRPKYDFEEGDEVEIINGYTKFDGYRNEWRLQFTPKENGMLINRSRKPRKKGEKPKAAVKKTGGGGGKAEEMFGFNEGITTLTERIDKVKEDLGAKVEYLGTSIETLKEDVDNLKDDIEELVNGATKRVMEQLKIIIKGGK